MAPAPDTYPDVFDRRGGLYHRAMIEHPMARAAEFRLALDKARLADGLVVCDVPSGGGYLARFLRHRVGVIGVEYSRLFAFSCGGVADEPRVLAEIGQIPLDNACCDRVISIAGLHHFDEPQKRGFFSEAYRVLRRGGLLLVADVGIDSITADFLDGFVGRHNVTGHDGHYLDATTPLMLSRCGFEIHDDSIQDYAWQFPDTAVMVDYCRLLFGLEGIDAGGIRRGVSRYLGYLESGDGCRMNWQLRFLLAGKAS